jgi:transposase
MPARFVDVDRDTPMLMPPDLRDWVADDDMVHFVIACADLVPMTAFKVNHRGCGDRQYPPRMMLALLVYCYSHGIFSSRRIERATHHHVAVRYLTAGTHPDHDTICAFRRENFDAIAEAFLQVLLLASEAGVLTLGTVSVDGTKMAADASINQSLRYDRAGELIPVLQGQIDELLGQAEDADQDAASHDDRLPDELKRRENLKAKLEAARARLEDRAKQKAEAEQADYQRKVAEREARDSKHKGPEPKPPATEPEPKDQDNLTDPDSRLMRKSKRHSYIQGYNAQATVDAEGSQLIVGNHVSQCAADAGELVPAIASIPAALGKPAAVLADSGYYSDDNHQAMLDAEIVPYISTSAEGARRPLDFRPEPDKPPKPPPKSPPSDLLQSMRARLAEPAGKALYKLRQQTVEPVFGIVRRAMGFSHFHLRGHAKVSGEWSLVSLAYNVKRLHRLLPARN